MEEIGEVSVLNMSFFIPAALSFAIDVMGRLFAAWEIPSLVRNKKKDIQEL